jgi:hypothetical protein
MTGDIRKSCKPAGTDFMLKWRRQRNLDRTGIGWIVLVIGHGRLGDHETALFQNQEANAMSVQQGRQVRKPRRVEARSLAEPGAPRYFPTLLCRRVHFVCNALALASRNARI